MSYIKSKYSLLAITAIVTILSTTQADASSFKLTPKQSQSNNTTIIALNQEAKTEFERGVKLYKEGDLKSAEAAFRKAIDLDSEFAEAYANLGSLLANQNNLSEAISQFENAVRLRPELAVLHYQLGVALYLENKRPEAVVSLSKARDLLKEQGKTEEAEKVEKAIERIQAES
ncbi:MAG: tetratricopeptide repeat protein [Okeania sp. SIO3I5]|uniref:tetratricopeptide repeat protein n=1 Tax=Okeania sp. SIO3I5 TaxID=2607805 RepID=UPI0013B64936|nr:tetratricopeptide repeat protein [Okeania sp. SIO3I5]NEQ41632.1 tetratricopeptide repeat protein [Okeania sp. SIO3I5]